MEESQETRGGTGVLGSAWGTTNRDPQGTGLRDAPKDHPKLGLDKDAGEVQTCGSRAK